MDDKNTALAQNIKEEATLNMLKISRAYEQPYATYGAIYILFTYLVEDY